jgi:hypothetical protein
LALELARRVAAEPLKLFPELSLVLWLKASMESPLPPLDLSLAPELARRVAAEPLELCPELALDAWLKALSLKSFMKSALDLRLDPELSRSPVCVAKPLELVVGLVVVLVVVLDVPPLDWSLDPELSRRPKAKPLISVPELALDVPPLELCLDPD